MTDPAPTILVVDDEEELNETLRYNLTRAGYDPIAAYDGRVALELIRARRPDLVMLDVMLPDLDGWSVCEALCDDPALRTIPVVIFTAKGSREDFDRGRSFPNVCGYFVKPYATGDVIRHVGHVLAALR
ncbi:MAG: response regulator [Polyangiales bacterium]